MIKNLLIPLIMFSIHFSSSASSSSARKCEKVFKINKEDKIFRHLLHEIDKISKTMRNHKDPSLTERKKVGLKKRHAFIEFRNAGGKTENQNFSDLDLRYTRFSRHAQDIYLKQATSFISEKLNFRTNLIDQIHLSGSNFSRAKLDGASFRYIELEGVNFSEATLKKSDLRDAYLHSADLKGADLQGADLRGADLKGSKNLNKANLKDALYNNGTSFPNKFKPENYKMKKVK